MAGTFDTIARYLPSSLVGAEAFASARTAVGRLPATLTHWVYFECRLAGDAPQVDTILAVRSTGRRWLAGAQRNG